ncbi:MAG TPA: hypothetical protein VFW17_19695 [Ktedonobacterales bacterium]|nr:hypothetical protein [Ktedonobacterales bacterium]
MSDETKETGTARSRRSMLRLAVPAAAGVAALTAVGTTELLHAPVAHANNGDNLVLGQGNFESSVTQLTMQSATGGSCGLNVIDESDSGQNTSGVAAISFNNAGLYGLSGGGFISPDDTFDKSYTGVYGHVHHDNGSGSAGTGYGVKAHANRGAAPLLLISTSGGSANGAPSTSAANGAMNVDGNGSLYSRRFSAWYPMATVNLLSHPIRLIDTRGGAPITNGGHALTGGSTLVAQITGTSVGGLSVPAHATAIIANMTAVPSSNGDLTIWADGVAKPSSSNLNYSGGVNIANFVICGLSSAGKADIFSNAGTTHVILDIAGFII